MNNKQTVVQITRAERFRDRLAKRIVGDSVVFQAHYCQTSESVAFAHRLEGDYKPIHEGEQWGRKWESAWFRLNATVPEKWKGRPVVAHLDCSGEGLVLDTAGRAIQGITNGSVFDADFARDIVRLYDSCEGGEEVELWVETAANGLFGVFTEPDPAEDSPNRYGHYDATVNTMRLCVFDTDTWGLWLDLRILLGLVKTLPEKSVRRARVIDCLDRAIDTYGDALQNVIACRKVLSKELSRRSSSSDLSVLAVGHAHIDTAWLWPVRETVRKCARTFASQLALIDRYPDYVFGASQPQHYEFVKTLYPELYERIRQAVKDGRWEPQGGMWVEADCNLISGESMVRQILHGKNFFRDDFGVDVDNLWLPDVFGYSAALPQILRKSGIKYFLTQKLSWNQYNEFPHHTFLWRGIDGSEVLTHFPPENNYNSQLGTDFLVPGRDHFKEKHFINEFISLFGVGDGGGGPKEENIELGLRMADLEGSPRVRFGAAKDFFDRLAQHESELARWEGELYLELHRGTYTTQAKVKRANRRLEQRLRVAEQLWSCVPLRRYPQGKFDRIWKAVLLNQFHDIIPGSSINKVYEVTHAEHEKALAECAELIQGASAELCDTDEKAAVVFNSHHYPFNGSLVLPESWTGFEVTDEYGRMLPVQHEDVGSVVRVRVEPYSFLTLRMGKAGGSAVAKGDGLILENEMIRYEFDTDGTLIRAYDKETGREVLAEGQAGNVLTLYEDRPNDWDAWDIDITYEQCALETARCERGKPLGGGAVRRGLQFAMTVGRSTLTQNVYLGAGSKRLDFETSVDWHEKHRMLRVSFPVNVLSEQASFDIQYGYVRRNTHRNTSWDMAKFEVCAHRYADLSDRDYGVALLNDCKYGHKVLGNVLDLNLLRSPTYPDPDADQGHHEFTYSLLPHIGLLTDSDVMAQAAFLNQPPVVLDGYRAEVKTLPWRVEGDGLSLEVVKKAEKEDCLVLRIVETRGRNSRGRLYVANGNAALVETNLMEWENGATVSCDGPVELSLKPFEIVTYKLKAQG